MVANVSVAMTPAWFRERLAETEGRVDRERLIEALQYVRDPGR
ncbi:hypothetical protein [Halomarina pelagica]|nr:hypothetical protein [Halomarina sp. BND7]